MLEVEEMQARCKKRAAQQRALDLERACAYWRRKPGRKRKAHARARRAERRAAE